MSLSGSDAVMVSDQAEAQEMISFIELVRVILDNARIHIATAKD